MTTPVTTTVTAQVARTTERDRLIGRIAWASAWVALVVGQLHALARHRTEDGKGDLDLATTRFWAEPAGRLARPLLDWGSPDLVYVTYGKLWLPLFLAFTACAFVCYRQRRPAGKERWVWRTVLFAYCGACVSVAAEYWLQWGSHTSDLLDTVFLVTVPFVLLTVLSSTVLGVVLLAKRFRPRTPAVLLALTLPGLVVIPMFTSLGNITLPILFAFGILGRRLAAS
jgi:hypothetical protein